MVACVYERQDMVGHEVLETPDGQAEKIFLSGVPETMLWPLWNRACEMRRSDRLIEDSLSSDLVKRIDYDFEKTFGRPSGFHPIRARLCDDRIKSYIDKNQAAPTIIGLGEGLETQVWRIKCQDMRWFSIDLPDAIDVRSRLMPKHPCEKQIKCSALDHEWMEQIPKDGPVFVSASGLLMYFSGMEVRTLLSGIASRFPKGSEIFFDTVAPSVSKRTLKGMNITKRYQVPKMPWGISIDDIEAFCASITSVSVEEITSYSEAFPSRLRRYRLMWSLPYFRKKFAGALVHLKTQNGLAPC